MSEHAHTPGPWRVDGTYTPQSGRYDILSGDEPTPELVVMTLPAEMVSDPDQNLANAHLIAASPQLLDACKMQARLIEDMMQFVGQMALQDYALLNEAPIAARAAIAKAEGT